VNHDKKVVIVEDNAAILEMYEFRLRFDGFDVYTAIDGLMGYKVIEEQKPHVVLLDLMLPYLRGADLLRKIRATDWGKSIRVIILTNVNLEEAPTELYDLNVDAYIVKALTTPHEVFDLVSQLFAGDAANVANNVPTPLPTAPAEPEQAAPEMAHFSAPAAIDMPAQQAYESQTQELAAVAQEVAASIPETPQMPKNDAPALSSFHMPDSFELPEEQPAVAEESHEGHNHDEQPHISDQTPQQTAQPDFSAHDFGLAQQEHQTHQDDPTAQ
jgi:DNA-binding response OmpR family regulator